MGFEMPVEPLTCKFLPQKDVLDQCFTMGKTVGEALAARCAEK